MIFIAHVYEVSRTYPKNELFALTDQIRRASVAIALNIAEGSGAGSDKEFVRFLRIALRSIYEVITAIEIARQLQYGNDKDHLALLIEVDELGAMLSGLIKSLKTDS